MNPVGIDVRHVSFSYKMPEQHKNKTFDGTVLEDISFQAFAGESIGIVGANGVGKSTLLKLLVGLENDFAGEIYVENIPVQRKTLDQVREKTGYIFQDSDSQLFMSTVYEDIAFAPRNYGLLASEVERRVDEALRKTGIPELKFRSCYELSGGQKKLVSIATILSMLPDIILMDEPSIALDPKNRRNLIQLLNSFHQLKIIASHDLDFILDTCERTILMADKKIIRDGPTQEILRDQALLEKHGLELPLSLSGSRIEIKGNFS